MEKKQPFWRQSLINGYGNVTLFWKPFIMESYIEHIKEEGFEIYNFDCSKWDLNNYHKDLATVLNFPDYYGKNLDAFNDCLSDMVPENQGFVLVFRNYDVFTQKHPQIAFQILDIIQRNSWRFLVQNVILLAFVQSDDARLSFSPLGGLSPKWNPEEWSFKKRGL